MRSFILIIIAVVLSVSDVVAQCAMCRSTLEVNYSNGNPGIASGINTGILYLLSMPYIAVMVLAYFWFKHSRNAKKELSGRSS